MINPWWPIAVSAGVGIILLISQRHTAYLQRQLQLRIEKHREDPSFPLEPPPSRIRMWLRKFGATLLGIGVNVVLLVYQFTRTEPINRGTIFNIAFILCSILYMLIDLQLSAQKRVLYDLIEVENRRTEADLRRQAQEANALTKTLTNELRKVRKIQEVPGSKSLKNQ